MIRPLHRVRALAYEGAFNIRRCRTGNGKSSRSRSARSSPIGVAGRAGHTSRPATPWSGATWALNAAAVPISYQLEGLAATFLRNHPSRPKPLKPSPEECFEQSLKLAPDVLETHEQLVDLYRQRRNAKKAEQAARRLLERFPEHVPTIEALADLRMTAHDYPEGIGLLEQAIRLNPLDRRLRRRLSTAHIFHARSHAEAQRFEEARAEYRAALALSEQEDNSSVYCKWAACEFKAGDTGSRPRNFCASSPGRCRTVEPGRGVQHVD